jgi:general secretion pathway protein A
MVRKTMDPTNVFSISPNPTAMFLTPKLKEAVGRFTRAIHRRQGLCAILGANGLGKSTLLRYLTLQFEDPSCYVCAYLPDSRKCGTSSFGFLKILSEDIGIGPKRSQYAQIDAMEKAFIANYEAGKNTIIFIDEAQRLSLEMFEAIRSLLNVETNVHKLVQFVIAGTLDLRDRLLTERYKAIHSRIVAPVLMAPLTLPEMTAMIEMRLSSCDMPMPFTKEALTLIHAYSFGVPRNVLSLCQQAYDLGCSRGHAEMGEADVADAFQSAQTKAAEEESALLTEAETDASMASA